jgi:hypothetical protein
MFVLQVGRLEDSIKGWVAFLPSGLIFSNLKATGFWCGLGPDTKAVLNLWATQPFR